MVCVWRMAQMVSGPVMRRPKNNHEKYIRVQSYGYAHHNVYIVTECKKEMGGQLDHHMMMDPIKSMPDCLSVFTISTSHVLLFSTHSLSSHSPSLSLSWPLSWQENRADFFPTFSSSCSSWNGANLKLNFLFAPKAFTRCLHTHKHTEKRNPLKCTKTWLEPKHVSLLQSHLHHGLFK